MTNISTLQVRPAFDLDDPSSLKFDLDRAKPKEVLAMVEAFEAKIKTNPDLGPVPVTTGWHDVDPATAINLLMRNRPGANRKVDAATAIYYGRQMANGRWKATGQPILLDANGRLIDAQHRLYGVVLSGATIKTYVVTDIEPIEGLFSYIDNGKQRTAATALQTAGLNGVSPIIVKVIKIAEEISAGVYDPAGATTLPRLSPAEVLELADKYPNARKAARSATSDWEEAVSFVGGRKDVVAYLGMRITDLHDEHVADDFFEEIVDPVERSADDPMAALRKLVEKDNRADKAMKKQYMLAALIKVFNAWHTQQPLGRRWMLQVDEAFPALEEGEPSETEAETEAA